MAEDLIWTSTDTPEPETDQYIRQMVRAHRMEVAPQGFFDADGNPIDHRPLNLYLCSSGNLIGGLLANTYFGGLHVGWLWVHSAQRNKGYARSLLSRAIEIAKERGCNHMWGTVWEAMGAHTLYEKLGAKLMLRHDFGPGRALCYYRLDF